jgi:hypothetical protein
MLKSVLQCYKPGKTEGFCMFYLLHVALHECYSFKGLRGAMEEQLMYYRSATSAT